MGILDAAEQGLLQSGRGKGLSDADLPLLDEARALLEGGDRPHGHVIVDEAQDLTPMQLRMLGRRSTGPFTVLGDIAQAAGPIAYRSWDDLLPGILGAEAPKSRSCASPTACRATCSSSRSHCSR